MSFGSFKGGGTGTFNSLITSSNSVGGMNTSVAIGDLIVGVFAETTALTVTNCTDNIHGTTSSYTAQNVGTLSTSVSGRMFYKVATSSANLTSMTFNATSSAHSGVGLGAIYQGPFTSVPIDGNPANVRDITTPFTSTATGALTSSNELVVGWTITNTSIISSAWVTVAPGIQNIAISPGTTSVAASIQSWVLTPGTSSLTASWTGSNPAQAVVGVATFIPSSTPDVLMGTMTL